MSLKPGFESSVITPVVASDKPSAKESVTSFNPDADFPGCHVLFVKWIEQSVQQLQFLTDLSLLQGVQACPARGQRWQ